jgi:poly(A) polymerase
MSEPVIIAREAHSISRKQIDPDALKVLYRLHQSNYIAYLVGGSVRDLLLGRRPKDFDIGTSAHPYQIKKLFRNCWIIGRRVSLAHVRFGTKTIEVATFRRPVTQEELAAAEEPQPETAMRTEGDESPDRLVHRITPSARPRRTRSAATSPSTRCSTTSPISRSSTTPAVWTISCGPGRCIGDPTERFQEDPVRMLRAVAMAARLGFRIDAPIDEAIARTRGEIARSAPARLIEEFYKLLRRAHPNRPSE